MSRFLDVSGAEAKVSWASEILQRSLRNYDVWSKSNLIETSLVDPEVILQTWVLHVKSLPHQDIILGFGDVLSNIRSALDYLAWEVFIASGGDPAGNDAKRIYFPIASDSVTFNKSCKAKLKGAWPEAVELTRVQQDYMSPVPHYKALQGLDALCNSQKHRSLHVAAVSPEFEASVRSGQWPVADGEKLVLDYPAHNNVPLRPGQTLTMARYWVQDENDTEAEKPLPKKNSETYPSINPPIRNVAISNGDQWVRVDQLNDLVKRVRTIVSDFSKLPVP